MKLRLGTTNKLFLAMLLVLIVSYSTLVFSTFHSYEAFLTVEANQQLEEHLNYARHQFLTRAEQTKLSLLQPASAVFVQRFLKERNVRFLKNALDRWQSVLPFTDMLTIVDADQTVVARRGGHPTGDRLELGGVIAKAFKQKQPLITTEILPLAEVCREGAAEHCPGGRLHDQRLSEAMTVVVVVPVVDRTGVLLGGIVAGDVVNRDPYLPAQFRNVFGKDHGLSITQREITITGDGSGDGESPAPLDKEILERLKSGQQFGGIIRSSGKDRLRAFEPIVNHDNEFIGLMSISINISDIMSLRRDSERNIILSALIGLLLTFPIALLVARRLTEPLKALSVGVEQIEQGDFTQRLDVSLGDEFGDLAAAFNRMADALTERDRTITKKTDDLVTLNTLLKELNDLLEKKVTERTDELRVEMGMLEAILTSMAEGVVVTGRENRITLFNPAAQRIFDLVPHRVLHQPIDQVCEHYGLLELSGFIRDVMSSREAPTVREEEMTLSGKKLKINLSPLVDAEGSANGVVMSIRDVTVEQEVDRMKSEFISTVSHELKTPLTSMKGSLQFIMNKAKWLTGTEREMLAVCLRNTERLIRLIGDILDISKIESGGVTMHCKPLSVGELALYAIEEIKSFAASRNITIVNGIEGQLPPIYGDHDRLMQVLTNLLSNAVKFSPEGKVVMVSAERQENYMAISVSDSGKEIQWSDREKLFKKFQQLGSTDSASRGGTGLGLAICKEIVERHHGKIYYTSGLSGGNVFTFSVPIYEENS